MKFQKLQFKWARLERHFIRFTWGGAWAAVLPKNSRTNLTLFFFDGLFAAARLLNELSRPICWLVAPSVSR